MTINHTAETFGASVEAFKVASPWLSAPHMPALVTLATLARTLDDGDLTPALVAQFGLTYRSLAKLAPATPPAKSPLAQALEEAQSAA